MFRIEDINITFIKGQLADGSTAWAKKNYPPPYDSTSAKQPKLDFQQVPKAVICSETCNTEPFISNYACFHSRITVATTYYVIFEEFKKHLVVFLTKKEH